jgi:hypothetical protein
MLRGRVKDASEPRKESEKFRHAQTKTSVQNRSNITQAHNDSLQPRRQRPLTMRHFRATIADWAAGRTVNTRPQMFASKFAASRGHR